jgi:hypothetical protein
MKAKDFESVRLDTREKTEGHARKEATTWASLLSARRPFRS